MKKSHTFLLALIILLIFSSSSFVFTGDFQDGMDAANRGDNKEAVRLFRLSADQGNATAQYNLGYLYSQGQDVSKNYKEAFKWFRIAAEQGLPQAQSSLGDMYANGLGVPQDNKEAFKWYHLSAEKGDAIAQHNLGNKYANGQGVPQDDKEAVRLFRLSAKQGNTSAQSNLGWMYEYGRGVPQDYKEAINWYRLSAEQGVPQAQFKLGDMYEKGKGVPQNYVLAHMWFSLSGSQGYQYAIEGRNIAEKKMTPQQIEKAQKLARNWKSAVTPCADGKDKAKAESIEAYQFGVKIQQAVEKEDVKAIFKLVSGELTYGPRKKDVSGKSFDTLFTAGWKEAILAEKPSCNPIGYRGFMLGNGLIWYTEGEIGQWSINSISGAHITDSQRSADPSWKYENDLLRSACFTRKWASGDNYEFYHEHYGGNSSYPDFVRNIGKYMGAKIPLEAVTADWGDKLSLAVELNGCSTPYSSLGKPINIDESSSTITIETTDEGVNEIFCSDTEGCETSWYTVLRNIPLETCGLLAPHFMNDCIDIRLVEYSPSFRGGSSPASIYGIIKDRLSKRIYMVPLVNLESKNDALNYVDKLLADTSNGIPSVDDKPPVPLEEKNVHDLPIASRYPPDEDLKGYPDKNNSIDVIYTNIINGMKVSVIWEPQDSISGSIVGEATIKFKNTKNGESFSIYNPSFGIGGENRDKLEESIHPTWVDHEDGGWLKFDKQTMYFEYEPEDSNVPFYFDDLDFDENKELIVELYGEGQRGLGVSKVYALKDGKLVDKHEQITDDAPYVELDGRSSIDKKNKTINIHGSSGACNSFDKLYRFNLPKEDTEKGKYILKEYSLTETRQEGEYSNCNLFVYRVDQNQKLTLISKETVRSDPNPTTEKKSVSPSEAPMKKVKKNLKIIQGANGGFKVILRIFETEVLAKQFRAKLLKKGLTPNIEQNGKQWEIYIGPYPSEESANQAKSSIEVVTNLKTSVEQGNVDTQFDKEAVKRLKLSAEQGNVDARDKLSLLLARSREARDYFEGMRVKKDTPNKLTNFKNPKESIKIHSTHFANCTKGKVNSFEFKDLIFYSVNASLPCLLSPLSKTKPRSKSKTGSKFDQDITESALVELDTSGKDVLLSYESLFDGSDLGDGPVWPLGEGLIRLRGSDKTIIVTGPTSTGVSIQKVSGEYIIVSVGGSFINSNYLISTTSMKAEYLSDGNIEVVDREKLIFKAYGLKSYFNNAGGTFWYNAIIDRNGNIIDIDNEDLDPVYKTCFSKSDFLKKADMRLPESVRDIVCVNQ